MEIKFDETVFYKCCISKLELYKNFYASKFTKDIYDIADEYGDDVYKCYLKNTKLEGSKFLRKNIILRIPKYRHRLIDYLTKIKNSDF